MFKNVRAPPKKRTNGYKMPDPLPKGEILEDVNKKKWKLGPSIGKGGFGEIYSAQEVIEGNKRSPSQYPYVVKIEPHTNGPLFVEMHFLLRNARKEDVEAFMNKSKLNHLGMPVYFGSGSHEHNNVKYRFIVIQKFGTDIWKLFLENKRMFPAVTVFKIGAQIIDVLCYIHNRGYVHHDIKGANILLDPKNKNQIYLVDFGLTGHYFTGKEFKPDPKKAHDGTLEYISRDGHCGLLTRRGDLEILGYNLVQWLGCVLPWENLKDPPAVHLSKKNYMEDIPEFIKVSFGERNAPKAILEYFIYLSTLKFDSVPDYDKLHKILMNGVDLAGGNMKTPLVFKNTKTPTKRKSISETPSSGKKPRLPRRQLAVDRDEDDEDIVKSSDSDQPAKKKKLRSKRKKKPVAILADETPTTPKMLTAETRSDSDIVKNSDSDIVISDSDQPAKKKKLRSKMKKKPVANLADETPKTGEKIIKPKTPEMLTAEMRRIKEKMEEKKAAKKTVKAKPKKKVADDGDADDDDDKEDSGRKLRSNKRGG